MQERTLGRSGIRVSAMGLGCWAIGGPFWHDGWVGYGDVDDAESFRAIRRALDLGITFFDTADAYGCGHSERILGQALARARQNVVIATKFGYVPDEQNRHITGTDTSPEYIRRACEGSLRRLNTDYIDLYQLHIHDYDTGKANGVRDVLEALVAEGKIRWYGWSTSTEQVEHVRVFAEGPHCTAIQHTLNVIVDDEPLLALCEELDLASINQGPLNRGILTGKFTADSGFAENDMRHRWAGEGWLAERLPQVEAVREVLTRDGRTPAQGALGWVWARSKRTIPIPGFKTVPQVEENAGALGCGPLSDEQMVEIDRILGRGPVTAAAGDSAQ
jgi:aryl-alcohol dehydrogenase-like predicted oxidoreductase